MSDTSTTATTARPTGKAHDFGVEPTILSVTPTRDNATAPGRRLPDKHTRLLCGKTLDEWLMLQLWSSKCVRQAVFVAETRAHAERLERLVIDRKFSNIEIVVRPRDMLASINDSGAIPIQWAVEREFQRDWYSFVTTPFVVSPCRPPGFFDRMVEEYKLAMSNPDYTRSSAIICGGYPTDQMLWDRQPDGGWIQRGIPYLNRNPQTRGSITNHWLAASWWYRSNVHLSMARHDLSFNPMFFDIEPWMDIHIDTEEDWEVAELWFRRKILSKGEDCYEEYRRSWAG